MIRRVLVIITLSITSSSGSVMAENGSVPSPLADGLGRDDTILISPYVLNTRNSPVSTDSRRVGFPISRNDGERIPRVKRVYEKLSSLGISDNGGSRVAIPSDGSAFKQFPRNSWPSATH